MLKEYIGKGADKIGAFIEKVRVGGFTIPSLLKRNRQNTKATLLDSFRSAVMAGTDSGTYSQVLEKAVKRRKRATLMTLKNAYSGVRGQARAILATGKKGYYQNISVIDGSTTVVCLSFVGKTWNVPYSQIENKPPRVPPQHPCRSFLLFREESVQFTEEASFMDQFRNNPELQLQLLGRVRFDAFLAGLITITSFSEYENSVLNTIEELGIE